MIQSRGRRFDLFPSAGFGDELLHRGRDRFAGLGSEFRGVRRVAVPNERGELDLHSGAAGGSHPQEVRHPCVLGEVLECSRWPVTLRVPTKNHSRCGGSHLRIEGVEARG